MVVEVSSQIDFSVVALLTNVTNETLQSNAIFVSEVFPFVSYKVAWIGY